MYGQIQRGIQWPCSNSFCCRGSRFRLLPRRRPSIRPVLPLPWRPATRVSAARAPQRRGKTLPAPPRHRPDWSRRCRRSRTTRIPIWRRSPSWPAPDTPESRRGQPGCSATRSGPKPCHSSASWPATVRTSMSACRSCTRCCAMPTTRPTRLRSMHSTTRTSGSARWQLNSSASCSTRPPQRRCWRCSPSAARACKPAALAVICKPPCWRSGIPKTRRTCCQQPKR